MKNFAIVSIVFLVAACTQYYGAPEDVPDSDIAYYAKGIKLGCIKKQISEKGDSTIKAEKYCGCMMTRLNDRVTHGEWQEATFYSINHWQSGAAKILAPHIRDLRTCGDGL
jgi:hypothetical protein